MFSPINTLRSSSTDAKKQASDPSSSQGQKNQPFRLPSPDKSSGVVQLQEPKQDTLALTNGAEKEQARQEKERQWKAIFQEYLEQVWDLP
jgi:hypothetical protein